MKHFLTPVHRHEHFHDEIDHCIVSLSSRDASRILELMGTVVLLAGELHADAPPPYLAVPIGEARFCKEGLGQAADESTEDSSEPLMYADALFAVLEDDEEMVELAGEFIPVDLRVARLDNHRALIFADHVVWSAASRANGWEDIESGPLARAEIEAVFQGSATAGT
jgi:hypothetical protein